MVQIHMTPAPEARLLLHTYIYIFLLLLRESIKERSGIEFKYRKKLVGKSLFNSCDILDSVALSILWIDMGMFYFDTPLFIKFF